MALDLYFDLDMPKMYLMTFDLDLDLWPWLDLDLSKMINGLRPRFWPRYVTWRPWPWSLTLTLTCQFRLKVYFYAQNRKLYNGTGNLFLLPAYSGVLSTAVQTWMALWNFSKNSWKVLMQSSSRNVFSSSQKNSASSTLSWSSWYNFVSIPTSSLSALCTAVTIAPL